MPKLYDYFGLIVMFYSNEHDPVHVHGLHQGRESRADFVIVNGEVVEILFSSVRGRRPLEKTQMKNFKRLVEKFSADIVKKWVDYFILNKVIKPERIERRLK
jgi:hypothetical protein